MSKTTKSRILLSLFDQKGIIPYAKQLVDLGWEIIATKETVGLLKKNKIAVVDIADFLGINDRYPFPPTLHPFIELVLTTDHERKIDFVYITTYPLVKGNDVGGNTILALAAKGRRIVVFNKEDMRKVIQDLAHNNNEISAKLRRELIDKTNAKIGKHYVSLVQHPKNPAIAQVMNEQATMPLLEGENPYQIPADLLQIDTEDILALSNFKQVNGSLPCYTNMADFDSLLQTFCLITGAFNKYYKKLPHIVIAAKHGNPCGLAIDWRSPEIAIENALFGNPIAIFGGEIITSFSITERFAEMLISSRKRENLLGDSSWMLDLIVSVDFDRQALKTLGNRRRLKLFKNKNLTRPHLNNRNRVYRMVRGGCLRQPPNNYILNLSECKTDFSFPNSNYLDSLIIAWATAWTSAHGGNEIAIAKNRMLLGAGGGPATINSCLTAIDRAKRCKHNLASSVFAANAFFPFSDAPEELVKAGCIYGVVPRGGKDFEAIENYFKKNKVKVFFLPEQFRGFCRH